MAMVCLPTLAVLYASTQLWALWITLTDCSRFYDVLGKRTHLVVDVSIHPLLASSRLKPQLIDFNLISFPESALFFCKRRHCLPPERKDRKLQSLWKGRCDVACLGLFTCIRYLEKMTRTQVDGYQKSGRPVRPSRLCSTDRET